MVVNTGVKSCFNNPQASPESWSQVNKPGRPGQLFGRELLRLWAAPVPSAAHAGSAGSMSHRCRSGRTSPAAQRRYVLLALGRVVLAWLRLCCCSFTGARHSACGFSRRGRGLCGAPQPPHPSPPRSISAQGPGGCECLHGSQAMGELSQRSRTESFPFSGLCQWSLSCQWPSSLASAPQIPPCRRQGQCSS